ncbi:MAG: lipopolysaccharide heptosyltransferase II [Burkholderiaceae bacterium]|nr:lipopolysaccharide heptosyltransferase II [Burkholderiaceae bacterium]
MGSRALVVAPGTIGEAVMVQPLLALLRQQGRRIGVDVLCDGAVAPVFRCMDEVGDVIVGPSQAIRRSWISRWRLGRALRDREYRAAYVLPETPGAALIPWIAGIRRRVGYRSQSRALLLNCIHEANRSTATKAAERFAALAFEPRAPRPGNVPEPRLVRRPQRERTVRAKFDIGREAPPIVLCTAAGAGDSRRWPARHFASLIALLAAETPETDVVLLGPATERRFATEAVALSGQAARNLCGETTLDEAVALVAQAAGVVTVDTGLMHVAAAYSRPQVALFGPSDPRREQPRSPRAHVEWLHLACSPCAERACPLVHHACMQRIAPSQVFEALARAMRFETSGARPSR